MTHHFGNLAGCCHCGHNPVQHPLPKMLHAHLMEDAMFNVVWCDNNLTNFAAINLLMALIV